MADLELLLFILTLFPGIFFIILLALSILSRVNSSLLYQRSWSNRKHIKTSRFFECAAYSRLNSQFRYDIQTLGIFAAFIIYDVDLIFFIPEVYHISMWSCHQFFFFFAYVYIFCLALSIDRAKGGFYWL